jgi:SAM-dependent methyltransferase
MRGTTKATIEHYLEHLNISGDVLEVGGYTLSKCAIDLFPEQRFRYRDLDIEAVDIPDTIVADITDCRVQVPDDSVDLVISCDVLEHIARPWLAAAEIARILRPGGVVVTRTVWAWRNHPCPIDYWRFSAECLEFLFAPLECLEKGYDLSERRADNPGFWSNGADSVPVDALGGFRENWAVYSVHRKGPGPTVPQFKQSDHPLACALRQGTQGTVTNPAMLRRFNATETLAAIGQRVGDRAPQLLRVYNGTRRRVGTRKSKLTP